MKILVCISCVPDTTSKINFIENDTKFDTNGIQFVINPNDEFGLTRAMWIKEMDNSTVDTINVGLENTEPILKKTLAIGADKAIRINEKPTDGFRVAKLISDYISNNNYDLIIAGRESIDYNGTMVPGIISEILNINFITNCIGLEIDGNKITAKREIEVGTEIEKLKKIFSLNEVAILVRAIFQTREFEERFLKIGLPYRIVGGIKFYERAEIKDCVAYLKVIHQPFDDLSFERIINVPKRSIGDTTIKLINEHAKINKTTLENAARKLIEENKIKPKTKFGLNSLLNLLQKWREDLNNKINHNKLLQLVLDESGYSEMLKNKKDLENENRLENIKELLNAMKEFDNLESFLEHVALATSLDQDWETEKVNLMTMHASKGLEFDVVFLPGWEEGLFPHQKSIEEKGENGLEEERRLAYVGITRAKKIAKISFSMNRFYQGDWIDSMSSRFIDELPDENLKKNNNFIDENEEDFEFNQDIEFDEPIRSPGWLRYQKKLNDK